jgi:putative Holliday junction resolvase
MSAALGIDLGERRIGIAIVEDEGLAARPLVTLRRGRRIEDDAAALRRLVDEHGIGELVVGLPLEAAGHEGSQAARTREWLDALLPVLERPITVHLQDERLTSHVAEGRVGPIGRGRSGGPPTRQQRDAYRARVDREAAAIILQDALDRRGPTRPTGTSPGSGPTTEPTP